MLKVKNNLKLNLSEGLNKVLEDMTNDIQEKRPTNKSIGYDLSQFAENHFKSNV